MNAQKQSRAAARNSLTLGGEPRVDLLPPEIRQERRDRRVQGRLWLGVLAVAAAVVLVTVALSLQVLQAQQDLQEENDRTLELAIEQGSYQEVRQVGEQVALVQAAQQVGASTEIEWRSYLQAVKATLPVSVTIDTVAIDTSSPLTIYPQPAQSFQGARVATVSFTATSASLPDVPTWLNALATLPGFADALPGSVDRAAVTGEYTVNITMHINADAFAWRFGGGPADADPAGAETTTGGN
jgi:hypothetical protein